MRGGAKQAPGTIAASTVYTLDELKRRTGLGDKALRMARRAGLPVLYVGCRGYVIGRDFIKYLRAAAKKQKDE